ncbi:MAG: EamA family transporter [Deltaproteobacteria bacterium]|nr:EamA family transporter [Deltaproteobacteria bacterium]
MNSPPSRGAIAAVFVLLSLIWGTTWAAIRVSLRGIPPFLGVSLRFALAAAVLLAAAGFWRVPLGRRRRERWLWLTNGILSFCGSYGIVYWAEQHIPSGLAAVIFASFPLLTIVLAHFFLDGERMTMRSAAGVLVGFAGLAVIYSEDLSRLGDSDVALASAVMLGSPIVSAVANLLAKRFGEGIHPISLTAVPMGMAAIVMGGASAVVERHAPATWEGASLVAVAYLALVGSALTFTAYYWLLARTSAVRTSLIAYTTPIVAVTVGLFFMDEKLTGRIAAGTAFVLAGVVVATWPERQAALGRR